MRVPRKINLLTLTLLAPATTSCTGLAPGGGDHEEVAGLAGLPGWAAPLGLDTEDPTARDTSLALVRADSCEEIAAPMKAKLVRNLIVYVTWYAAWQGVALGAAAGLDPDQVVAVVDAAERWSNGATFLVRQALARGTAGPGTSIVEHAGKDLGAALALAADHGLDLPVVRQVEADYASVVEPPGGGAPSACRRTWRRRSSPPSRCRHRRSRRRRGP